MSKTTTVFPIVAALQKMLEFGKATSDFQPTNDLQQQFLQEFFKTGRESLNLFSEEELQAIASSDASVINKFLEDRGFDIRVDEFDKPEDFGTAAVMTVAVEWMEKGERVKIKALDGQVYPGVSVEYGNYHPMMSKLHKHPIVQLNCKNGDSVYMTIADKERSTWDLLSYVSSLVKGCDHAWGYEGFHFPMVDLNQEVDISFFEQMNFLGEKMPFIIKRAKQQTKFKMNEEGAKVESAVSMDACACAAMEPPKMIVIDRPFFVWMVRRGMTLPYFAGYITMDDCKDNRSLDYKTVATVNAADAQGPRRDQTYMLQMHSFGKEKIQTVKTIKEVFNCSLGDAKTMLQNIPCVIARNLSKWDAEVAQRTLVEKTGARIELESE